MKYTRFVSTLAAISLSLAMTVGSAHAVEDIAKLTGLYGGVGAGVGLFDDPSDEEDAWRLMAWWRPFKFISAEIGYIDAGDPGGQVEDVDGLHLALVPTLTLPAHVDLFAKGGGFFAEESDVTVGLGAAYHLPLGFGIRLDWDRLNVTDSDNVDVISLAVFYHLAKQGR